MKCPAVLGIRGSNEAVERKSERMDTAYSPRLHEEELSATASQMVEEAKILARQ